MLLEDSTKSCGHDKIWPAQPLFHDHPGWPDFTENPNACPLHGLQSCFQQHLLLNPNVSHCFLNSPGPVLCLFHYIHQIFPTWRAPALSVCRLLPACCCCLSPVTCHLYSCCLSTCCLLFVVIAVVDVVFSLGTGVIWTWLCSVLGKSWQFCTPH